MDYIEGEFLAARRQHAAGLRAGLRRARGHDLGHRLRRAAPARRGTGCHVHLAHMQTRRSIEPCAAPRRAASSHLRGQPLGAVPRTLGRRRDARPVRAVLLGARRHTAPRLGGPQRRHDRHALLRPRAAHARGEGDRLDDRCGGPHGHARHPVPLPLLLDAAQPGELDARARGRAAAEPAEAFGLGASKGAIEVGADADLVDRSIPTRRRRSPTTPSCPDRLDAVRRPRARRASSARSSAAAWSTRTARSSAAPASGDGSHRSAERRPRPPDGRERGL